MRDRETVIVGAELNRRIPSYEESLCSQSFVKMEEDNDNPAEIDSIHLNKVLNTSIVYFNKKRKFQAEQLGLPIPKHTCCKRTFGLECDSPLKTIPEAENFHTHTIYENAERGVEDEGSEPESAKDSNSLSTDLDSSISVYGEAKFEPEYTKTFPYDQPSSSSVNWGGSSFKNSLSSLDGRTMKCKGAGKEELTFMSEEHNPPHNDGGYLVSQNLEEQLLEFGNALDYMGSEYGIDSIEHCTDKENENPIDSCGVNPNIYVLSSGRWSVNQEAQQSIRKPTIDQEFEQYFSTLML